MNYKSSLFIYKLKYEQSEENPLIEITDSLGNFIYRKVTPGLYRDKTHFEKSFKAVISALLNESDDQKGEELKTAAHISDEMAPIVKKAVES